MEGIGEFIELQVLNKSSLRFTVRGSSCFRIGLTTALVAIVAASAYAQTEARKGRGRGRAAVAGFGQQQAFDRIAAEIRDSLSLRKTLVVWMIEETSASASLAENVTDEINRIMRDLGSSNAGQLEMAVVGYGNEVNVATPEPAHDALQLQTALSELRGHQDQPAHLFAAFKQAVEKFLPYRDRGYEVIFVVVGASSGDDGEGADQVVSALKRKAAAVFGVGPTIAFGLPNFGGRRGQFQTNSSEANQRPVESLFPERIQLALADRQSTQDLVDSGYGPFGLERLCRQTGGKFFRLHETNPTGWETDPRTGEIKSELLAKYAPDYVSAEQYQRLLTENKCRMALHNAALLPPATGLESETTSFQKGKDEATLAKGVTRAQEAAAIRDQPLQKLYDALIVGEADRPKLTGARWQAGYDLAMGQVLAAKARLDGYNAMLAALKQGKSFANPDSTRWVLEPADDIPVGSALDKMAKNSRVYLKRVIDEHKGTPWAAVAERELRVPAGWKFVEQ